MIVYKTIPLVGYFLLLIAVPDSAAMNPTHRDDLISDLGSTPIFQTGLQPHDLAHQDQMEELFTDQDSLKDTPKRQTISYQGKGNGTLGFYSSRSGSFGIDFVNSISFYDYVAIGIGAGVRIPFNYRVITAPVYADLRLSLSQKKIAPILEVGWGGTFQADLNYENAGQILLIQAGVKIKSKQNFAYLITMGYEDYDIIVSGKSKRNSNSNTLSFSLTPEEVSIPSITLSFGILF